MENSLFPIKIEMHIIFAVVAAAIFIMQFIRLRKKYYLVLAIAVPATLLAYLIDSRAFFYGLGIAEGAALIAALILSKTTDRDKAEPESTETPSGNIAESTEMAEETAEAPAEQETAGEIEA